MLLVPYGEFLHRSSLVEQSQGHAPQQVLQVEDSLVGEDLSNGVCRLGSLVQPVERLLTVDLDGGGDGQRIVGPDLLDELAVAGRARVGHDDEIEGAFLAPVSL